MTATTRQPPWGTTSQTRTTPAKIVPRITRHLQNQTFYDVLFSSRLVRVDERTGGPPS